MNHRLAKLWSAAVAALALVGCSDLERVESRYVSFADAKADTAVERGYLPPWLPDETREIHLVGDLDTGWFAISFVVPQPHAFAAILEAHGFLPLSGEAPDPPAPIRSLEPTQGPERLLAFRGTHHHGGDSVVVLLDPNSGVVQYWSD